MLSKKDRFALVRYDILQTAKALEKYPEVHKEYLNKLKVLLIKTEQVDN